MDASDYLDNDEAINAYLEDALETNDASFVAHALGVIARARKIQWPFTGKPLEKAGRQGV